MTNRTPPPPFRPAVFLDRDGVINVDHGYVHRIEDFEFVDGVFDFCRDAHEKGYLLVVVTNQAGIGRGYYTEAQFLALTEWMRAQFDTQGAPIAAVYHCPCHPEFGTGDYKRESFRRKPNPGMLLEAAHDLAIDLKRSHLLGDKASDLQAGLRAGVGYLHHFDASSPVWPMVQATMTQAP